MIRSRAVLVAIGIDWEGRRQLIGVEMANRESSKSRKGLGSKHWAYGAFFRGQRRPSWVQACNHGGLACWQRCLVHFYATHWNHLPRKGNDDGLVECDDSPYMISFLLNLDAHNSR